MKHKLAIAAAATVVLLAVGSTVAWASTRGPGHTGNAHMSQGHMSQGDMGPSDMKAMMASIHTGLDPATLDLLVRQCTDAIQSGTGSMRGSGGMMSGTGSGGMTGGVR